MSVKVPLVAVQADPLQTLNPQSDTSLKLCQEAYKRGTKLFAYTPNNLTFNQNKLSALGQFFSFDTLGNFKTEDLINLNLNEADFVLIRQDPPVNQVYLTKTYLLEQLSKSVKVINDPKGLRIVSEKLFTLNFPNLIPPTLVTSNSQQIVDFIRFHKQVIMKPLYEYGGRGIVYLQVGDSNIESLLELYQKIYPEGVMVQQYLPEVKQGDKRIIMIDGQPIGAFLRQPAKAQVRSNLRVGGSAVPCALNQQDYEICETLAPYLKKLGMYLVGLDVIGSYLTEVNVTSPTGFCTLEDLYGIKAAEIFWDKLGI